MTRGWTRNSVGARFEQPLTLHGGTTAMHRQKHMPPGADPEWVDLAGEPLVCVCLCVCFVF